MYPKRIPGNHSLNQFVSIMKRRFLFLLLLPAGIFFQHLSGQPSWQVQNSPVSGDLIAVSFVDTSYGWAVTNEGMMIHTVNGGEAWETLTDLDGFYPNKIFFQDRNSGWMVGSFSNTLDTALIMKTSNGGLNWERNYYRIAAKLNDVFFVDENVGFAVGFEGDTLGLKLETINGGQYWLDMVGINIISEFYSVHFRDSLDGVICGSGPAVQHTNYGGLTEPGWALIIFNFRVDMYDIVNVGSVYGCMVGAGGKLWFTKDDWNNYLDYDFPDGDTLRAVDALEPLSFYAVGDAGTILTIGYNQYLGLAVQDHSLDISDDLLDVDAVDDAHIWAVGENGTILFFGFKKGSPTHTDPDLFPGNAVYPNPAKDRISIPHNPGMDSVVRLYDLQGTLVRTFSLDPANPVRLFELDGLPPGIYLLNTGRGIQKVVVME
jgi:photosystem II stability/assembly factor-like uncharacterized protein